MVPEVLLTLSGIKKSFSKPVLNSIDMQLNKSECLGLLGANGAGGDIAPGPEAASLSTGALEGSNVNPVEVLVNLMDYYRSFETQMKLVKSAEELDQTGTRLMQTS